MKRLLLCALLVSSAAMAATPRQPWISQWDAMVIAFGAPKEPRQEERSDKTRDGDTQQDKKRHKPHCTTSRCLEQPWMGSEATNYPPYDGLD